MKTCPVCKIQKNYNDFYKNKARKDGVNVYCIECQKSKSKQKQDILLCKRVKSQYIEGEIWRDIIEFNGFLLLILGGASYSIGTIFYSLDKKYAHTVWHLFVLAGSTLHFFFILFFIYYYRFRFCEFFKFRKCCDVLYFSFTFDKRKFIQLIPNVFT